MEFACVFFWIRWHFFRFGTFKFIINTSTLEACKLHKNKIIIGHRQTLINTIDFYFIARLLCVSVCVRYVQLVLFWFCFSSFFLLAYDIKLYRIAPFDFFSFMILFNRAISSIAFYLSNVKKALLLLIHSTIEGKKTNTNILMSLVSVIKTAHLKCVI